MEHDISAIDAELMALEDQLHDLEEEYDRREDEIDTTLEEEAKALSQLYETHLQTLRGEHASRISRLQEEMEGKLQPLQEEVISLKRHRNSLVPGVRLPPELLASIFFKLQGEDSLGPLGCSVVCAVCSQWRSVSLAYQALWSRIYVERDFMPDWVRTMLSRSGDSPLEAIVNMVVYPPSAPYQMRARENSLLVWSQSHRLRSLRICADSEIMNEILLDLNYAAPILNQLTLQTSHSWSSLAIVAIPPTIFRMQCSHLSHVTLEGGSFSLRNSHLPSTITHLSIHSNPTKDIRAANVGHLCTLLERIPQLRWLSLRHAMTTHEAVLHAALSRPCVLPKLEELIVVDEEDYIHELLTGLSTPELRFLRIERVHNGTVSDLGIRSLLRCISRFLQLDDTGHWPKSAEITINWPFASIMAWTDVSQKPRLSLFLLNVDIAHLANVSTDLGLSHVDAMIVTSQYEHTLLTGRIWQTWLSDLQSLTTLNVALDHVQPFLCTLKNGALTVPMLRTLMLQRVDFALPAMMEIPDDLGEVLPAHVARISTAPSDDQVHSLAELLCSVVRWRQGAGVGLHLLHLRRCRNLDEHIMDVLRQLVDRVVWETSD